MLYAYYFKYSWGYTLARTRDKLSVFLPFRCQPAPRNLDKVFVVRVEELFDDVESFFIHILAGVSL